MSVSVAVLREVAADVESDSAMAASLLRVIAVGRDADEVDRHPDAALASALLTAYRDDGEVHYVESSSVPEEWLRMAGAARAQVDAERREPAPREWDRVQDIPDGVRFTDCEKPDMGSWVREGSRYHYRNPDGITVGVRRYAHEVNTYAPFSEVTE